MARKILTHHVATSMFECVEHHHPAEDAVGVFSAFGPALFQTNKAEL